MKKKRAKKKPNVDYRYRWPTQQTLVESRVSMETSRSECRWKFCARRLRQLRRMWSPGPGKSTHPYDTGIGEPESVWGSGSRSAFAAAEVRGDGRTGWKKLIRTSFTSSSPAVGKNDLTTTTYIKIIGMKEKELINTTNLARTETPPYEREIEAGDTQDTHPAPPRLRPFSAEKLALPSIPNRDTSRPRQTRRPIYPVQSACVNPATSAGGPIRREQLKDIMG